MEADPKRPEVVRQESEKANPPTLPPADVAAKKLTPEEQMALFEKDLKENDWGHQPC